MKRLLFLVPWMAMTAAAWGQTRSAELSFTHFASVRDHVFRVDDECYVSPSVLRGYGWTVEDREGTATVRVDDRKVRVAMRSVANELLVPLTDLLTMLGLSGQWEPGKNVFDVYSVLNEVKFERGHFSIDAALPVVSTITTIQKPPRTVIDLTGARLVPTTHLVLQDGSRIGQYKPNVVRVVIEGSLKDPSMPSAALKVYDLNLGLPSTNADIPGGTGRDEDAGSDPLPPNISTVPITQPSVVARTQASQVFSAPKILAGPLTAGSDGPTIATLSLKLSGQLAAPPNFRRPDPNILEIVLPNTTLQLGDQPASPDPLSIESVETRVEGNSAVLALHLVRPMGLEISLQTGAVQIRLLKPVIGNGQLAGKVVVIDAGHGGHDSGAQTFDHGVSEKNLTLAISKLTAQRLAEEGATVIMTRKTDDFISLSERPAIGNRNHADFFISIHINANGLDTSSRGTITFYHLQDPISQVLAACLISEIKKVSGIPAIGTWSDGKIYHSGFAVLRGSKMPAVLVECGFINNASDLKKMLTDEFKQNVAKGIVSGLKVYLGQK